MNEILDKVWLDNSLKNYLIVAGIILLILFCKKYVAHYVAGLIFPFIKGIWKEIDKKSFTSLVARPLGFFLFILISLATLHKLRFPTVLNVDIFRTSLKEILHTFGTFILIVSFIRLLHRIIDFIAIILHIKAERTLDTKDDQLVVFFKDFFKVVISVIGVLMVMKFAFGFQVGNVLTGLSIVGAAIALALRESLENLIASFIIFFDKPFSMGDVVKVHNFTGTVEKIGLRSTRIRTDQKTFITVPNKQMVDSILDNLTLRTQRKGELKLELGLSTSSEQLSRFINEVKKILTEKEIENSTVLLSDITPSAFLIQVDYFTGPVTQQEFNTIKERVNFGVLRLMESLKLEISGASTDIKIMESGSLKAQD